MKKVIIAYFSLSGKTETMARYVAEGVRFTGNEAVVKKMSEIKSVNDLTGYDGYIFGSPTYYLDAPDPVKTFLFLGRKAGLKEKLAGAYGPRIVFDTMQHVYDMEPFELGPFNLKEALVETNDGMRACQAYGRAFGEKLGT
jgi:flavodoxin